MTCGLRGLHPMLSPWSPRHPHVIPTSSPLSQHHPHSPQKVPMWSPWPVVSEVSVVSVVSTPCCPRGPHVIPVSSPSSPHHLKGPHIIPNPPDTHSTHPHPPGGWGPWISKNAIKFELIEIFKFCLKIWNLWRLPHLWVGAWVGGWVGGWVG